MAVVAHNDVSEEETPDETSTAEQSNAQPTHHAAKQVSKSQLLINCDWEHLRAYSTESKEITRQVADGSEEDPTKRAQQENNTHHRE